MIYEIAPNGVHYLRFKSIPLERVRYGVFTRHGGISPEPWQSLNFSITVGDRSENVQRNNILAHEALALEPTRQMDRHLVHSTRVWHVDQRDLGMKAPRSDGLVTRTPKLSLVMTFADCQPILAYCPVQHTLGLAHAGWRGTLGGIALSLVRAMEAEGCRANDLLVALGPSIGNCCYEVGLDVVEQANRWPGGGEWLCEGSNGRFLLDLNMANEAILRRAGVQQIEKTNLCTACRTDLFFSYRGERPITGRFAVVAALNNLQSEQSDKSLPNNTTFNQ